MHTDKKDKGPSISRNEMSTNYCIATNPGSELYLQVRGLMHSGSQHVSYHAGQRTFTMLHAGLQTLVKGVSLPCIAAQSRRSYGLYLPTSETLLPFHPNF